MKYVLTTKKTFATVIKKYLENKVGFIKTNEDGSETLELDIQDEDDLLRLIYVGMEISDLNHGKNWYYSESDL